MLHIVDFIIMDIINNMDIIMDINDVVVKDILILSSFI